MLGFTSTVYAPTDADGILTSVCTCTTSIHAVSGATYKTNAVVDCITSISAEGLVGLSGSQTVNCDTDIIAISNRLSGSAVIECITLIDTFIGNNPGIKVYDTGVYQGMTEGLDFVGATITYGEDKFTITTSGGTVEVDYRTEIDPVSDTVTYYGFALPGSATNSAVWKIQRKLKTGDDSSFTWANGTALFDKTWDNRATYTY